MNSEIIVNVAPRLFRAGALEIADPNPSLSASESWALVRDNYPHLAHAQLSDPTLENGHMIITVELPPAKVNG